ncbi:histidine phosphatase family protein [Acetobacter vaccinii]|uniref:Histidine phosphatase family protein n=1 Tax=Acetobacter vaccinii TaxID=2592655 RepID=A0A5C1YM90_9PROT|nr:histidine phosphatase family protein [Acetobacter vaccinii]QEO16535.1 histidine phosphatase family protein [Acetobacter vaccinii]
MIILRHCESEFNRLYTLHGRDPNLPDPGLSARGLAHAQELVPQLTGLGITRILVSPFTRALQTARPLATALGIVPEITPLIRERGLFSCDEGTPASTLAGDWPALDFSHLAEHWWSPPPEPDHALNQRAQDFRTTLKTHPHPQGQTLVVSHWWFLLALSDRSLENGEWRHQHP